MKTIVNEVKKLSRVWQHINSDRPICLMTAFRGQYTYEENVSRNKSLAADVRNLGYGFFYVDGFWIENQGTSNEQHVSEDTLFITGDLDLDDYKFQSDMVSLGKKYDQEAVLVKTKTGGIRVITVSTGEEFKLSKLSLDKMGDIYTKLRSNKKANTFIFENERDDLGWLQRLAGIE